MITIELPTFPPGLNGAYPTVMTRQGHIRRALSPEAQAWKALTIPIMRNAINHAPWQPHAKQPLVVTVDYWGPRVFGYDLDGKVKLLLDALADALGVDDRYVVDLVLAKRPATQQKVVITVRPAAAPVWSMRKGAVE